MAIVRSAFSFVVVGVMTCFSLCGKRASCSFRIWERAFFIYAAIRAVACASSSIASLVRLAIPLPPTPIRR